VHEDPLLILLVDDHPGVANAIGRLLGASGHDVHVSHDAAEGIALACRLRPDLILHDIVMVPMDGYEAARRLRNTPGLAATVLIACSASVDERKAREAGFDGWLIKPITDGDLDTVLAMVRERRNNAAGERAGAHLTGRVK
jgi:two-component system CheB/CheR fusion protein